jgi:hypothetical protein
VRIEFRLICLMALAVAPLGVSQLAQPAAQEPPSPPTPQPEPQEPSSPPTPQPAQATPQGTPPLSAPLLSTPPVPSAPPPSAQGNFVVGDIRVEGLQRISEGTVFNYLPVNIGDHLDQQRIA